MYSAKEAAEKTGLSTAALRYYIMSFSNALCGERGKAGIKVTTLCPGGNGDRICCKSKHSKCIAIQDCSYEAGKSSGDCLARLEKIPLIKQRPPHYG